MVDWNNLPKTKEKIYVLKQIQRKAAKTKQKQKKKKKF